MSHIKLSEQQELQGIAILALLGSVAAGKTSICKYLTGETTQKHSKELINGCTMKMGYKNLKIYYNGHTFLTNPKRVPDGYELIRHFSIADNPGHNSFMATLVTGLNDVDLGLFLISGTNGVEQQSYQHMKCFKTTGIKNMAMIISKVDLVNTGERLNEIRESVDLLMNSENLDDDIDPPIIPLSTFSKVNMNEMIKYLVSAEYPKKVIELSQRQFKMTIVRSFDVNRPRVLTDEINGAVFGGAIQAGYLAVGDTICVMPGVISYKNGNKTYTPLVTQVTGIMSDKSPLNVALPGGFIAISTTLDPYLSKSDTMVGNTIIKINSLEEIDTQCFTGNILDVVNLVTLDDNIDLKIGNEYFLVVHGMGQYGTLKSIELNVHKFELSSVTSVFPNDKIAIMQNDLGHLKMLSYGDIITTHNDGTVILEHMYDAQEFLLNLPIEKRIHSIEIENDLKTYEEFNNCEELYNFEELASNIGFVKKPWNYNYPVLSIVKNTTCVAITNANELVENLTNDLTIKDKICRSFADYIKQKCGDKLKKANINIGDDMIRFNDVRNADRKITDRDLNELYYKFIHDNFTCKTCTSVGSVYHTKNKQQCKHCGAILSTLRESKEL